MTSIKRFLLSLCAVFFILLPSCVSSSKSALVLYKAGTYEGIGDGFQGPIRLRVTVSSQAITNIEVIEHRETPGLGSAAIEELTDAVLDVNSTDVDSVSGASASSNGFLSALEDALLKAKPDNFRSSN